MYALKRRDQEWCADHDFVQSTNGGAVSSGSSGAMSMFIIVH
jgi:hypothetical protein